MWVTGFPKREVKLTKKVKSKNEPAWLDPANDRKTPYTEDELDLFVDGFINSMDDGGEDMIKEMGEEEARKTIKEGFRKMDERYIGNMKVDNPSIN